MCVCSVVSNSLVPHRLQPARLLSPWNSLGKNTERGFHFLLQGIFLSQRSNPLLCLLHWQMDSSPLSHFFCVSAASGLQTQKETLTWSLGLAGFHSCISQILTINNKYTKLCVYIYKLIFLFKKHWKNSSYWCFFFFLDNPRDRGAWWAAVYGITQSWKRLKWLSSSSSSPKAASFCQFVFFSQYFVYVMIIVVYDCNSIIIVIVVYYFILSI